MPEKSNSEKLRRALLKLLECGAETTAADGYCHYCLAPLLGDGQHAEGCAYVEAAGLLGRPEFLLRRRPDGG